MAKRKKTLAESLTELQPDERVTTLLRENARLRKAQDVKESGVGIIRRAIEAVYQVPSGIRVPQPKRSRRGAVEVPVLHVTDVHYGKKTGSYNVGVCEARMLALGKAVGEIIGLRREFAKIDRMKVLLGGDMGEGEGIFPGQAHEMDADLVAQMIKDGPEITVNLILSLLRDVRYLEIEAVPGNHGRQSKFGAKRHNADSVFYEIVRAMFEKAAPRDAKRVKWNLPLDRERGSEWYARFNVVGEWEGMLVHGDQIKGMLGFPWYGAGKKVGGWRTSRATAGFHFLWMGHFHTDAAFDVHDARVFATASPESDNEYALEFFASGGRPKQRLGFFNESRGLLVDSPIHL